MNIEHTCAPFKANIEVYCRGGMQEAMAVDNANGTVSMFHKGGNALIVNAGPSLINHLWCNGWLRELRTMEEIWAALSSDSEPAPIKVNA